MGILSGPTIIAGVMSGDIVVDPFSPSRISPNSVDVTLDPVMLRYVNRPQDLDGSIVLDVREENPTEELTIPSNGLVLVPGVLYLGSTVERIGSNKFVAVLEGKSSLGRLGLCVHVTAGFIDCGFFGQITCEITCVHPIRIYPHMKIGQVCFSTIQGPIALYRGKYQNQKGAVASRSWKDWEKDEA